MTSATALLAVQPLARTGEGMKSGPIGLAIILLLCIACYFLFKSMSGHLRKVRDDFPKTLPTPPANPSAAKAVATPTAIAAERRRLDARPVDAKPVEPKTVEAPSFDVTSIEPRYIDTPRTDRDQG
jgi:hypothetical protein